MKGKPKRKPDREDEGGGDPERQPGRHEVRSTPDYRKRNQCEVQQTIQLAVKAAPMRSDGAVGEIGPPASDRAGILQERLELRCEDRVAVIDRVLRIAT